MSSRGLRKFKVRIWFPSDYLVKGAWATSEDEAIEKIKEFQQDEIFHHLRFQAEPEEEE